MATLTRLFSLLGSTNLRSVLLGASLFPSILASQAASAEVRFNVDAINANVLYEEFTVSDRFLDKDEGELQGFATGIEWRGDRLFARVEREWLSGDLDYSATGIDSSSAIKSENYRLRAGYLHGWSKLIGLAGVEAEYAQYERDIASTGRLFGLDEDYSFFNIGGFVGLEYTVTNHTSVGFDVSLLRANQAEIDVTFLSNEFDPATFDLGDSQTWRAQLHLSQQLSAQLSTQLSAIYTHQTIDRSARAQLFSQQAPTTRFATQPRTEKDVYQLNLGLSWSF